MFLRRSSSDLCTSFSRSFLPLRHPVDTVHADPIEDSRMRTPAMLPPPPPPNPTWEATQQSFAHFRDLVDHLPKSVYEVVQLKQELDSITRANWFLLCREWARPTRGRPAQSQAEALIRVLKLAVKQYFPYRVCSTRMISTSRRHPARKLNQAIYSDKSDRSRIATDPRTTLLPDILLPFETPEPPTFRVS